jgi:WhiB family transcriptional regulator, redox-sensing transcriptional regulator
VRRLPGAEPWGVWGGEIFERGTVVPRKRPRGRPRKEDVAKDAILRVEVAARVAAEVRRPAEAVLSKAGIGEAA